MKKKLRKYLFVDNDNENYDVFTGETPIEAIKKSLKKYGSCFCWCDDDFTGGESLDEIAQTIYDDCVMLGCYILDITNERKVVLA